jgi:hypothetical protein
MGPNRELYTIREWQKRYKNGDFTRQRYTLAKISEIGWIDWWCSNDDLGNITKKVSGFILGLRNSSKINLDTMRIHFYNSDSEIENDIYRTRIYITSISEGGPSYFVETCSLYGQREWGGKWVIFDFNVSPVCPVYVCNTIKDAVAWFNK